MCNRIKIIPRMLKCEHLNIITFFVQIKSVVRQKCVQYQRWQMSI